MDLSSRQMLPSRQMNPCRTCLSPILMSHQTNQIPCLTCLSPILMGPKMVGPKLVGRPMRSHILLRIWTCCS